MNRKTKYSNGALPPWNKTDAVSSGTNVGAEYSADEVEFMMAMEKFKREKKRPFPKCSEILEVLRSLGYRKVEAP